MATAEASTASLVEMLETKAKQARERAHRLETRASELQDKAVASSGSADFYECLAHMCRDRQMDQDTALSLLREAVASVCMNQATLS